MIKNNRKVIYKKLSLNVKSISKLFNKRQYRYYPGTGFYIKALSVILPGIGNVRMAIVKNGYNASIKNTRFIITNFPDIAAQDILKKYLCRWDIEVFFRDIKQCLNFEKVPIRSLEKLEGYFYLMFISSVFVQIIQIRNGLNTMGETISYLKDIVQIKVDNIVYIINVSSKDQKSKEVNLELKNISNNIGYMNNILSVKLVVA